MSTFLLLTITGLGLGAMYFLIASGLSLIYGLMGVLNFAHGAFITVGGYGDVVVPDERLRRRRTRCSGAGSSARSCGLVARRRVRRARRARPDPAALPAPHRAGARHGRPRSSPFVALVSGIWGAGREGRTRCRRGSHETTTIGGAHIPNDRWVEIATAAVVLALLQLFLRRDALRADHPRRRREPRDGARRSASTCRKAFTLVFAIGGVAAALAGVLSGVYFNVVDPEQGTSLLIFAFIVVVIGGLGSIGGSAVAAVARRPDAAVHELLRVGRASATWSSCCCSASCCSRGRAGSPARRRGARVKRDARLDWLWPLAVFGAARVRAEARLSTIPKLFDQPIDSPGHARAARAVPRLRRRSRSRTTSSSGSPGCCRSATRCTSRSACYLANIAITEWHWSFWQAIALHRSASRSCVAIVLGFVVAARRAGSRSRWSRSRSRRRARCSRSRTRTTGRTARRASAPTTRSCRRRSSASSTRRTSTGSRSRSSRVVFFVVRWAVDSSPGRVWQAIRENEPRVEVLGLRPRAYKLQAFVLSSMLAAAGGIVYMLLFSGSTLARDAAELHADAAADGRDRRRGLALGRRARRHPLHVSQRPARRDRQLVGGRRGCRTRCARRSSSRSSCSASSSSSSSSSCRAGSPGSSRAAAPTRAAQASARRSAREADRPSRRRAYERRDARATCRSRTRSAASGEPLVLVHGLGYDRAGWGRCPDLLAEHFRVVLLDNRGVGESDAPRGPVLGRADGRRRPCRARRRRHRARASCSASRLGGFIAQELALDLARARRQARPLLDGGRRPEGAPDAARRREAVFAKYPDDGARSRRSACSSRTRSASAASASCRSSSRRSTRYRLEHAPSTRRLAVAQATAGATFDATTASARSTSPTLVVHGGADIVVDPRNAELLGELIPNARVEIVPDRGHLLVWEESERVAELMTEFLQP